MTSYPPTPEALLADRGWRIRNSLWVLPVGLIGCLTWASFLYVAVRAKKRAYWIAAAVYLAAFIAAIVLSELGGPTENEIKAGAVQTAAQDTADTWMGGLLFATWIGGIIHALMIRKEFLRILAYQSAPNPVLQPQYANNVPNPAVPQQQPQWIADYTRGYWAPNPAPAGAAPDNPVRVATSTVAVNSASVTELLGLGLSAPEVDTVLAARARPGGIRDLADFAAVTKMKPHQLPTIAERLDFTPASQSEPGPRLDLPSPAETPSDTRALGRRLDL
ncbi:hypothetical protein AB0H76_34755 [Nocardia sp. NPDC050712]|uniref:hypothetical protein n=1 Tax=Nocardia sp. NPDC050712 TaxID=3155518 RepID=UPI0034098291